MFMYRGRDREEDIKKFDHKFERTFEYRNKTGEGGDEMIKTG